MCCSFLALTGTDARPMEKAEVEGESSLRPCCTYIQIACGRMSKTIELRVGWGRLSNRPPVRLPSARATNVQSAVASSQVTHPWLLGLRLRKTVHVGT